MHNFRFALNKTVPFFLIAVVLTFIVRGPAAKEPQGSSSNVKTLVRMIVDAYGGEGVLENIHSLSATGVLETPLYGGPADYSVYLKRDRKLRVETSFGKFLELRILNGTHGYYRTESSPIAEVSGPRLLSMIYQFKELTMPYQLMTSAFTIGDGDRSVVNGIPVSVLSLNGKEGPPMKLYVDERSHLILKDSGVFIMDGAETELSSEFHDFRKVNGRPFPFRVVNYAGGQKIGELHIRTYRVNPDLPESLFRPGK